MSAIRIEFSEDVRAQILNLQRLAECDLPTLFRRSLSLYERLLKAQVHGYTLMIVKNDGSSEIQLEVP